MGPPGVSPEWEVLVDDSGDIIGVICEGCLTREEEQAIYEDEVITGMEAEFLPDDG